MNTFYYTASSLDGFIADSDHSLDWLFQFSGGPDFDLFTALGAIAMGSSTYQWLLKNEIRLGTDQQKPWPYSQPTWVFTSRTLPPIPGADIRFVSGDVRAVHEAMVTAAKDKNIWVAGGGELVGQFYDCGLLDEIIVDVVSVTLGSGAPILPRRIVTPPLRLVCVKQRGTDFVQLTYEVEKSSHRA